MTALLTSSKKTILPFATSQANQGFNGALEKAAVFCLSELNRQKGGGFIRKQEAETLVFISKILYPFWLAPFKELTLLLDGLKVASHTITYPILPDVKEFIGKLNGQQMTRQLHANFLSNNQSYFQISNDQQQLTIDGLLNDAEFTDEFLEFSKTVIAAELPISEVVLITPASNEEDVSKIIHTLEGIRLKLSEDLADLNKVIKRLNSKKQESQTDLRKEIKNIENEFIFKIQKAKTILDDKVAKINKTYSSTVTEVSDRFEQKTSRLQKDLVKTEKEKGRLETEIGRAESEIKCSAINKDDSTEQKWKEKRNKLKEKRPEINYYLKDLQRQVDEVEETKKNELFKLKQDNEAKIKEAGKDLAELEAERDARIKVSQNEIEKIEESTSNIIEKANELVKNRETTLIEFDHLGFRQKREAAMLVYVPFYLSCYRTKTVKRYSYLAPSVVSEGGFGTRLKSLGKTKISQLFKPRDKKLTSILNSFIGLMDENIVFSCELSEACLKANVLQTRKDGGELRSGLIKLKEQGWLSNAEFEEFNQALSQYFSG